MDSLQVNKSINQSEVELIDWSTPPMVKNFSYDGDYVINNPFDMMESKASNMDPFDLVLNETLTKRAPPCGNMLSPLWELKCSRPLRKSVSLTDINGVVRMLEQVKVDKYNEEYTTLVNLDEKVIDQSKKKDTEVNIEDNKRIRNEDKKIIVNEDKKIIENEDKKIIENEDKKIIENEDNKIESVLTNDCNNEIDLEKDIEKRSMCNEDEKKLIREQTRQRIQMLIERGKKNHEEECSRKSLFCTPLRNNNLSLNKSESLFNKGFLQSGSHSSYENSNKIQEILANSNDSYKSNFSPVFHDSELNSFDLNSLKPEWVMDNFSDSDGSMDIQIDKSRTTEPTCNDNDIDAKLKALNRIGIVDSKSNACRILKFAQNKKNQNKGPFLANVPLKQMVNNYKDEESKEIIPTPISPRGQIKPVASSTPTTDLIIACKTPSTTESSIKSRTSESRRSMLSSVDSISTPLNVTKCIGKNLNYDIDGNKLSLSNVSNSVHSVNKRSNTTIVLYGEDNKRKLNMAESIQSYKLNKSKSLSKIGKIPKPMTSSTNKISGLPVPKRFSNSISMSFKGKENVKPQ